MSWTNILIEVFLFSGLGFGYYYYQKRKIIRNTKLDIRARIHDLLNEVEHSLNPDEIDQHLIDQKYLLVRDKIRNLAKGEELEQMIQDLEEINKYA